VTSFVVLGVVLVAAALLFVVPPLLRRGLRRGRNARCRQRRGIPRPAARARVRPARGNARFGPASKGPRRNRGAVAGRHRRGRGAGAISAARARRRASLWAGRADLRARRLCGGRNPRALLPQGPEGANQHGLSAQQFEALVSRLAARLKDNPRMRRVGLMLGRSYACWGARRGERSLRKAAARMPRDAQLLADYADALAMAQGQDAARGTGKK